MPKLVVIAKITAVEGKAEDAKALLKDLIEPTSKEDGYIQYDLHQDNSNPNLFYFYEIWESMDHLKAHGDSEHIREMRLKSQGIIEDTQLSLLTKVW